MKRDTLLEHIEPFQAYNRSRNLSPRTIQTYRTNLNAFFGWLDEKHDPDAEIDPRCIRGFIAEKLEMGQSPNTARGYLIALRALFSFLVRDQIIDEGENPMRLVKNPKRHLKEIVPLTPEEIKRFLGCLKGNDRQARRNRAMVLLMLDSGLRAEEVTRLTPEDVDLERRRLVVRGKGGKVRTVYIGERTQVALSEYLEARAQAPLFPSMTWSTKGRMGSTYISYIIRTKMQEAGVWRRGCSSSHRLRHTFAVNFIRGGGDAFSLQRILGHSSLEMTRRYVLLADGDLALAHAKAAPVDGLDL